MIACFQLDLFKPVPKPRPAEPKYPWLNCFPTFVPLVGGIVQVNVLTIAGFGYSQDVRFRVQSIEGEKVSGFVQNWFPNYEMDNEVTTKKLPIPFFVFGMWKYTDKVLNCSMQDLWPCVSVPNLGMPEIV